MPSAPPLFPYTTDNPDVGIEPAGKPAVVDIGDINADAIEAQYQDDAPDDDAAIFTDYQVRNHYELDGHIYMGGVTSPGGFNGTPVAFVQLANQTLIWIADWTAARFSTQPLVPDPTPASIAAGWVLLDQHVEPAMLRYAADGVTPLYRISGYYVYGKSNPSPILLDDIKFGRPPYMIDSADRTMPRSKLAQGIIN